MTGKTAATLNLGRLPNMVGYHLRMAQLKVFGDFEQALAGLDITPVIVEVLEILSHNRGMTQTQLAAAIGLDRSSLVPLLNKLQKRQLVAREASNKDRRTNNLHLKSEGAQLLAEAARRIALHAQDILAALSKKEAEQLIVLLMRLGKNRTWASCSELGEFKLTHAASPADQAIRNRCKTLGLSLAHAKRLAAENDRTDPQSLLRVLGLDFTTLTPMKSCRWLWMAAQTSSTTYPGTLTPETLLAILTSGEVPPTFAPHVRHLLGEARLQVVIMAVEQAARQSGAPIEVIWRNVERIEDEMQSCRKGAWMFDEEDGAVPLHP